MTGYLRLLLVLISIIGISRPQATAQETFPINGIYDQR